MGGFAPHTPGKKVQVQFQADCESQPAQCTPLSFFSVLPEKKDSAAPGGRKKRALRAIDSSVFDSLYARLPNLGVNCIQVGNLLAPVSADGFAYARAAACAGNGDQVQPTVYALRGESKEGPKPLFVSFQLGKVKGGRDALSKRAGGTFVAKAGSKLVCDQGRRLTRPDPPRGA